MINNPETIEVKDEGATQGRARIFDQWKARTGLERHDCGRHPGGEW